jgi:hypothetical protein
LKPNDEKEEREMTGNEKDTTSFFQEEGVETQEIRLHDAAVPLGLKDVSNPSVGIGGAYGTWGESTDNNRLPDLLQRQLGRPCLRPNSWSSISLGSATGIAHRNSPGKMTSNWRWRSERDC